MSNDKYIHSDVEDRIYSYWEKNELFKPKENTKKFSIVIPPPNVTGSLHMGHALNNSIQDLLIRYHRMNNYETLDVLVIGLVMLLQWMKIFLNQLLRCLLIFIIKS